MYYELYTQPLCHKCPKAKELVKKLSITGNIIECNENGNLSKARKLNIMETPTLIVYSDSGHEQERFNNIEEIEKFVHK
jgi:hypothetical protein